MSFSAHRKISKPNSINSYNVALTLKKLSSCIQASSLAIIPGSVRVPGASTQLNVLVSYLLGVQVTVERTTLMRSLQSLTTTHIVVRAVVVRIKLASIIRLSTG